MSRTRLSPHGGRPGTGPWYCVAQGRLRLSSSWIVLVVGKRFKSDGGACILWWSTEDTVISLYQIVAYAEETVI